MEYALLPYPKELALAADATDKLVFSANELPDRRLEKFAAAIASPHGDGRRLRLNVDKSLRREGEYVIAFACGSIEVSAASPQGLFYGLCTLAQLNGQAGLGFLGRVHDWADLRMRIQMIDLKRIGWNYEYLISLVGRLAALKINYLLIEYEDKIKYDFCDAIPAPTAFTKGQTRTLVETARENFVEIIPLVQCLAHYEYILRHDKYRHLREEPDATRQACPLKAGTFELFAHMAEEVLELHPDSKYFHVGGDEPTSLGACPACAAESGENGKGQLYVNYLNKALRWVGAWGRTPLFWDDMVGRHPEAAGQCHHPSVAVNWDYSVTGTRTGKLHFRGLPQFFELDHATYAGLDEGTRRRFDKYLDPDAASGDFDAFPMTRFLADNGFAVIGASNVRDVDNVLAHSVNAVERRCLGHLATYWASSDSDGAPYTVFESRMPGVAMLAASSWNSAYERERRPSFFARLCQLTGASPALEALNGVAHLLAPSGDCLAAELPELDGDDITSLLAERFLLERQFRGFMAEHLAAPLFPEGKYLFLDLSGRCDSRFADTPELPGWTGEGLNDMRFFPQGRQCFQGVPFAVLEDRPDGNKSVLLWDGGSAKREIELDIPSGGARLESVHFLHTVARGKVAGEIDAGYWLEYADGQREFIPARPGVNLGGWWDVRDMPEADMACAVSNLFSGHKVGMHVFNHQLRRPEAEVKRLRLVNRSATTIAVAAITAVRNLPGLRPRVPPAAAAQAEGLLKALERHEARIRRCVGRFVTSDAEEEIVKLMLGRKMAVLRPFMPQSPSAPL